MTTAQVTNLKTSQTKGFTLIELLVVIAIIAILAVIGLTVFQGQQANARDAKRRADINAVSQALEAHISTGAQCNAGGAYTGQHYCGPMAVWFTGGNIPTGTNGVSYTVTTGCGTMTGCTAYTGNLSGLTSTNGFATYTLTTTLEAGGTFSVTNQQ